MRLLIADGVGDAPVDPLFDAHTHPICKWTKAIWAEWFTPREFEQVFQYATKRIDDARRPWGVVGGPGTGIVTSTARISWHMRSYHTVRIHDGTVIDLAARAPAQVKVYVKQGCRAWRWERIGELFNELVAPGDRNAVGACWRPPR